MTTTTSDELAVGDFNKYPGISTVPSPSDYHKTTGLVHCVMKRETSRLGISSTTTTKVRFAFQHSATTTTTSDAAETVVLLAEKDAPNAYSIYDSSKTKKLGSLHRIQSGLSSVSYALYQGGVQIATILYVVPSVVEVLRDAPPRRAQVAFLAPNDKTLDNNTNDNDNDTIMSDDDPNWFDAACKDCIRKNGNLDGVVVLLANTTTTTSDDSSADCRVVLLESKVPYVKSNGRVGLNFQGRGREASPKNMQLVVAANSAETTTTTCQMAKWEHNVYNVDFGEPFTMFHAFGFGLAQLDL